MADVCEDGGFDVVEAESNGLVSESEQLLIDALIQTEDPPRAVARKLHEQGCFEMALNSYERAIEQWYAQGKNTLGSKGRQPFLDNIKAAREGLETRYRELLVQVSYED